MVSSSPAGGFVLQGATGRPALVPVDTSWGTSPDAHARPVVASVQAEHLAFAASQVEMSLAGLEPACPAELGELGLRQRVEDAMVGLGDLCPDGSTPAERWQYLRMRHRGRRWTYRPQTGPARRLRP